MKGVGTFLKILQRYVLREVLSPILLALVALTLVLVVIIIFSKFEDIAAVVSLSMLLRLVVYLLPSLLTVAIPMAILTGVLLGVGRLTVDSEIKSMRAHGVSLYPVFGPVLVLGVVAAALTVFNSLWFAPKMLTQSFSMLDEVRMKIFNSLEAGRFEDRLSTDDRDIVLYFTEKDEKSSLLKHVYMWYGGESPQGPANGAKAKQKKGAPAPEVMETLRIPVSAANIGNLPAYTIEYWAQTNTTGTQMTAVGFGNRMTDDSSWISTGIQANGCVRFDHAGDKESVVLNAKSPTITDGLWHHVACVRAPEGSWQLYCDGSLVTTRTAAVGGTTLNKAIVGVLPKKTETEGWEGWVGNVRISNRARTHGEIAVAWRSGPRKSFEKDAATLWMGRPKAAKRTAPDQGKTAKQPEEDTNKTLFLASSGRLTSDPKRRSINLTLTDGSIHVLGGKDDEMYSTIDFGRMANELPLQPSEDYMAGGIDKQATAMTAAELRRASKAYFAKADRAAKAKRGAGTNYRKHARELSGELLQRVSISLACFAFVLIGLPLAIYIRPSGKSVGVSIAFVMIAVYYLMMHFGVILTQKGSGIGPAMVFFPNVLLTILGLVMLHRTVHR